MLQIFWEISEISQIKKAQNSLLKNIFLEIQKERFWEKRQKHDVRLIFCDSPKIKELNQKYRGKKEATDVLSFAEIDFGGDPFLQEKDSLGEIYINYEWVKWNDEYLKRWGSDDKILPSLFLHGLLHLLGFDHEKDKGEMEKIEKKLKNKLL